MREEQDEILDSKIKFHDRHRFEIKLDIDLAPRDINVYRVETYFFVPRALNINPSTYTKNDFYNSAQKYIRFKTPQMTPSKIADPAVKTSPLARIAAALPGLLSGSGSPGLEETVHNELKMLGCVSRASLRDHVKYQLAEISALSPGGGGRESGGTEDGIKMKTLEEHGLGFVRDVRNLISRIRGLRGELANPIVPVKIRESFGFFDEFLSITVEDYLTELLAGIHRNTEARRGLGAVEQSLADIILAQGTYRRAMGYPSLVQKNTDNEGMVYRRGVLKKFISSILYLHIEVSEWKGLLQFLFGMAAGIAMLFAAVVMFYAQNRYATNSLPFMAIVVISYIFKDRIKDWLKLLFSRGMTRWIADRKVNIRDPRNGQIIGTVKEAFSFMADSALPSDIFLRRNIDNITSIDEEGKPERVFKYEKEVRLYSGRISKAHERRRDLNDIMRFSISDFLDQADDPRADHMYLSPETGELECVKCMRVYHINMVIKYISGDSLGKEKLAYERIRIVLSRDGIVRLEEVPVA
ncbi:MAG: hypothetical protein ABIG11_06140 [bacterium]